jgi:hypothetical protein
MLKRLVEKGSKSKRVSAGQSQPQRAEYAVVAFWEIDVSVEMECEGDRLCCEQKYLGFIWA